MLKKALFSCLFKRLFKVFTLVEILSFSDISVRMLVIMCRSVTDNRRELTVSLLSLSK